MQVSSSLPTFSALASQPQLQPLPLIRFRMPAGFPSPANDYIEDGLDLNCFLVQHKEASFMFNIEGDSMRDAGILDGDKVIVDRAVTARHGCIVIAVVDGDYTVKRLYKRGKRVELHPANPAYAPIVFNAEQELQIWGVVVGSVRRYV
jgi:DNA polymerase V